MALLKKLLFVWIPASTFGGRADPVEVAGEFLGHVRLASSWQAHHHDDSRGVGEVGGTSRCRQER